MSYKSHFSILLGAMFLAACAKYDGQIRLVAPAEYTSRECWYDASGKLMALLVIAEYEGEAVPYVVSSSCIADGNYSSYGVGILLHLNALRIDDSNGALKKVFPSLNIVGNVATDLPMPSSGSKVYYFKSNIEKIPFPSGNAYAVTQIQSAADTGRSFDQLLGMSLKDRELLRQGFPQP